MTNEIDEKWIDNIAKCLEDISSKEPDSFDICFEFAVNVVRQCCSDPYTKTNFLLYLLLSKQELGMGFDEELFNECRILSEEIIDFDLRQTTIGGLVMNANRANRSDLREKAYRRIPSLK